jgi:hypothetical protein
MPFEKGQSGNPTGRPKSRPFKTALAMELAEIGVDHKALREIASKLIEAARGGELQAINALGDRMDGKPINCVLMRLKTALSDMPPHEAIAVITDHVADGELSPQQGQQMISMIEARIKAVELAEIDSRLRELEKTNANR